MYHLRKLKSLLLLLLVAVTAKAQLSDGKVYNFVSVGKGTSMSITANDVIVTLPDERKYSQLWYAASEGNGFTLRNLANGHYLKSPNATSEAWSTVKVKDENCIFTATPVGGNYAMRVTGNSGGYNYMHADGGNTIVCWESSNANSQWTMNVVNIDAATLNANWNALAAIDPSASTVSAYQTHLDNLFSDKACTTLKKSFANENAVKNDVDYKALPVTLQEMVLKVYNDSWAEDNYDANKSDWDADYAKKYRVQWYEPYNEPEAAASALGINAHTNLNNPTGIFANDREALYVMVEGEIKTGASLYITSYTGNGNLGGYDNGIELKQGLNIVPSFGDGNNYCINYVIHTFDTSKGKGNKAKAYRLSAFEDLKIHIEGGYINGYYNKMGDDLYTPDQGANWDYLEARATQTTVTILGKYITLQFPLNDAVDNDGKTNKGMSHYLDQSNVKGIIDEWDNVMLWERLVLGLLDEETTNAEAKKSPYSTEERVFDYTGNDGEFAAGYEDYYNVHGLSLGVGYNYMYGGWDHCGYHYNTMESILTNLPYNAGSHWGPGHEIGHQHQSLLTVNGLTEVTNNLFSNVVLWYYGETTSRYNGSDGALSNVLAAYNTEGSDFFTNNIWALTHMYYKLFLYYHVLGHNTKFYPRLFEMLRQDPMSGGYNQNGATSLLHFYKKCCLASGDDLTEFFRAHGFFSVMDNRLVGDYSNSVYTTTQADIDAAIEEVKALDYDENIAVLFINDATGETIKSHKGDNLELYGETTVCAEVGGYASFADNTTPDYTYSVSGTTVSMEGTGGTGFAIFNEKGEIIAFSDKKTFTISEECAVAIASGKAEIKAVQADNTIVEAVDVMDTDNAEAKYEALGGLLDAVKAVIDLADATGTKVGYYRTDLLTDLQDAYETAKTVYDNKTMTSYTAVYDVLYQEYANVVEDDFARIGIIEGNVYRLTNGIYTDRSMAVNTSNNQMSGVTTADTDEQKWYFEASNSLGRYYLKNKSTGKYPGDTSSGSVLSANKEDKSDNGAYAYELRNMGNGLWALVGSTGIHCSASQGYNIVGWGADAEASQWYITAVEIDQNAETHYELQTLINRTEVLVDEMATVQGKGTVDMSTCTITSNATETGHETKYLTDGNPNTFFHTVWSGSAVGDYHNIVIDLGEGHSLSQFVLNYSTLASGNVDAPESLTVQGSADGSSYTDIASLSALNDALPTTLGKEYTSSTLGSASQAYRYIRLQVKTATGGKLGSYYYFGLAELGLTRMSTFVESIGDKYANFITAEKVATVCDQVYAAQQTIALGSATSNDVAALQAQYDILLAAYENANNVEFNAKKEELLALIGSTNSLIGTCGTITYIPATLDGALALQTNNPNGCWYVSSNADQNAGGYSNDGGGIDALVDNNYNTYFHTRWDGTTVNEPHHIQVDMGNGVAINDFVFSYKPRNNSPAPTSMIVYGSNDENSFTEVLATIESGLPAHNSGNTYTSSTIVSDKAYRYLRFTVTGSQGPGNNKYNNQYFFGMLEFDLTAVGRPESYTAELSAQAGEATEELLLTTYHAANAAQEVCNEAITESQLQNAIDALQAKYDALHSAMYPNVEYTILVVGGSNGGVQYEGQNYTESLSAPATLTIGELSAIVLDGYVAKVTLEGQTITIIYNKVYTVTIIGGEGEGRLTFNETEYANDETFNALQSSFTAEAFTIKDVEGYNKSEVTVNHETGIISVTYTLDKTALNDLLEETLELIAYCNQTYVNSEFVTESLISETNTAWVTAQEALETVTTRSELNAAVNALQEAHDKLDEAKTLAEDEATERTELNRLLSALITETKTLITSCYENDVLKFVNSEFVTEETISAVRALVEAAEAKCSTPGTTATEFNASISVLTEAKSNLTTAIENAEEEAEQRVHLKAELQTLVDNTNTLMALCGEIRTAPVTTLSGVVTLQTTLSAEDFYLSTNAQEESEGDIAGLTDNDADTYFHSSWKARVGEAHYLQVDMGAQYALKEFAFSYTTRNHWWGPSPSIIVVSGSNSEDDDSFVELATYSDLPSGQNQSWETTENIVAPKMPYRYLRFTVTQSNDKHSNPDEYFFAMSKFSLTAVPTEATPYADVYEKAGVVTEAQLLEVYYEKESALSIINSANNTELAAAKEALQAKYDALNTAYTTIDKSELAALLPEVEELINSCYTDGTFNYTGSLYVTTELMDEMNGVVTAAHSALDNTISQDDYDVALADLKNAQAELQYAIECALFPVLLTADPASPALYIIKTKRDGDNMVLQYDEPTELFSVTASVDKEPTQAFYFMKGDGSQVYIYPYMAGGKVLAANEVGDASGTAFAMEKGSATYEQWVFVARADGYYNLQPVGTSTYLSNIYGTSHKMGFYSYGPDTDKGSLFKFESTTVEGSYYYLKLKDYYENQAKVASSEIQGVDAVGYYPTDKANAYNSAYSNATSILNSSTATDEEYTAVYNNLKEANEMLELNMPSVDKFYRIVSVVKGDGSNAFVYANPADNKMYWATGKDNSDATAIWKITPSATEGKYNISNLHTGSNINGFIYYDPSPLSEVAGNIEIESLSFNDGQVGLKCDGTMMHAQGGGAIVHWGTGANDGSAWRIVEVTDEEISLVEFALIISQYRHAGLYLNYAAEIPEGVKVYIAHTPDGQEGTILADELDGTILPARTAVIVKGNADTYNFKYTTSDYDGSEDLDVNLLGGSAYLKYQQVEETGNLCCVFGQKSGEVGLYKNWVQYVDANGSTSKTEGETTTDYTKSDGGTHFKISANKIYYEYQPSAVAGAAAFRFRFNDETGIEELIIGEDSIIYDLYGRRLNEVVTPGIYIVNGKKIYVNEKMISNK